MTSRLGRALRPIMWGLGAGLFGQGIVTVIAASISDTVAQTTHGLLNHDARHGVLHVVWGTAILILLLVPSLGRYLTTVAVVFGVFYLWLGVMGVVTHNPFGLLLGPGENIFHFTIGTVSLAAGLGSLRQAETDPKLDTGS